MKVSFRARRALGALAGVSLLVLQAGVEKSAQAQESSVPYPEATTLEAISIFATREARRLLDVPQTVTVVTREELEKRMVRDIQDLVRYEPGVTVSKTTSSVDPWSNNSGFTIRGVSGNRVQMLVDGTRVIEGIVDGNRDFVNMSNLKSVEIIRGPAGVMWGADALGGLVAFVTKDPEDYLKGRNFGGQVGTYFDSYDKSFYKSAAIAARFGQFAALVNVSQRSFNEGTLSKARADGGMWGCPRNPQAIRCNELNPLDGNDYDILTKLVWTPDAEHEVKLTGEFVAKHSEVDQRHDLGPSTSPAGSFNLSHLRDQDQNRMRATLSHKYTPNLGWIDALRWQVSYNPFKRELNSVRRYRSSTNNDVRVDAFLDYQEKFYEGDLQLDSSFTSLGVLHKLTYGAYYNITETDYERRDTTTDYTAGTVTVANAGGFNFANATTKRADAFFQDEMNFLGGRIQVTPGVRYATYSLDPRPNQHYVTVPGKEPRPVDSQNLVSQVSTTLHLNDRYSTYFRFAEGFKMPTAQQLYTSLPGTSFNLIPNPDLKPEAVESYEIGLRGKFDSGYFSVAVFKSDYDNFIQNFVSVPNTIDITYANLSRVNLWGVEVAGEYKFTDKWSVNVTASWVDGTQVASAGAAETKFDGTTPVTIVSALRYFDTATGLDAQLIGTFADQVGNRSSANLFRAPSYAVYDALLSWKPKAVPGLTFNASVLNLLDTRYFRSLNGATTYQISPTTSVRVANPLELQTAPGRTFKVGANYEF